MLLKYRAISRSDICVNKKFELNSRNILHVFPFRCAVRVTVYYHRWSSTRKGTLGDCSERMCAHLTIVKRSAQANSNHVLRQCRSAHGKFLSLEAKTDSFSLAQKCSWSLQFTNFHSFYGFVRPHSDADESQFQSFYRFQCQRAMKGKINPLKGWRQCTSRNIIREREREREQRGDLHKIILLTRGNSIIFCPEPQINTFYTDVWTETVFHWAAESVPERCCAVRFSPTLHTKRLMQLSWPIITELETTEVLRALPMLLGSPSDRWTMAFRHESTQCG